jgi:hypothetical protein
MDPSIDQETGAELVKLLLQVAFADDEISLAEREALDAAAMRLAGSAGLALVVAGVDRRERLLPPDLGRLKAHRSAVLQEVARLSAVDGVHEDELEMVKLISGMLR